MSEEPSPADIAKALGEVSATDLVKGFLGTLIGKAWESLGLWLNPAVGETRTDLPEARVAIDAAQALFSVVSDRLTEEERREIRRALADLQVNYVERAKTSSG